MLIWLYGGDVVIHTAYDVMKEYLITGAAGTKEKYRFCFFKIQIIKRAQGLDRKFLY